MTKEKLIKLRCKAWGITESEYYCNQCSDFSLEDMSRAYRRGKNKGRNDFEKENAEDSFNGKKVLYKSSTDKRSYIDGYLAGTEKQKKKDEEQLNKAKEIIKYLLRFIHEENYKTRWDIDIAEAEQFLKEE